jgi:hypothetical protein
MPDDRRLCRRVVGHAVQLDRPAAVPERRRASTRTDSTRQTRARPIPLLPRRVGGPYACRTPARPCDGRVDHVKPQPSASRKRPLERRKGRRLRLVRPPGSPIRRGLASLADTSLYTFNLLTWPRRLATPPSRDPERVASTATRRRNTAGDRLGLRLRPSERSA